MRYRLLLVLVAVAVLASFPSIAEAQGAACTGMCWRHASGSVYCGFTALQEGGHCIITTTNGIQTCELYACGGSPGWFPENQGLLPWLEPAVEREFAAEASRVTVVVVEPRT